MKIRCMDVKALCPVRPFYAVRLRLAQNGLEAATDALIELTREAESRLAVADPQWQEGPEGRRCDEALTEIARTVAVLRGIALPDGRLLR